MYDASKLVNNKHEVFIISNLEKFARGIKMGEQVFSLFLQKAKDENVKDEINKIIISFQNHQKNLGLEVETNTLDSMCLFFEKMKIMAIENDFQLCKEMTKAELMGIHRALAFLYENKTIEDNIRQKIEGIISDYDNQMKKLILLMKSL